MPKVKREARSRRTIIVGGVAGGASCAARLRRLDEEAEIIMVERGPYISFANCGLPYHIGGVIDDRDSLLVQTPESFRQRFSVEVRVLTEVVAIDAEAQTVTLRDLENDSETDLSYDSLVLSPGASPFLPPIEGVALPGVHVLRTIPDMDRIIEACEDSTPGHVTVVGGGFIGLEVAENMVHRGIDVTVVEMGPQLMPNLDFEMAASITDACVRHGVEVWTNTQLTAIKQAGDDLQIQTRDGKERSTDLVMMAVGVRPTTELARGAGLVLSPRGYITVDATLRTSDPNIFAIGDAIEVVHRVSATSGPMPLAGPANRQGRLVADIIAGRERTYCGPLGTSIIQVFDITAACTGISEAAARRMDIDHQVVWINAPSHASYYPGAETITLKAIFDPAGGKILGAQGFGKDGVDKRIDVLATAIAAGMTVAQLEELDLAYAPPFSSAKDPVNHLGSVASGVLESDHPACSWRVTEEEEDLLFVDVRTASEFAAGTIDGAVNIPLEELRARLDELPRDTQLVAFCQKGLRGYLAARILLQRGFEVRNLLGGYRLWQLVTDCQK